MAGSRIKGLPDDGSAHQDIAIDKITRSMQVDTHAHIKIHQKKRWYFSDYAASVGAGATRIVRFKTAWSLKTNHFHVKVTASAGALVELLEATTFTHNAGNALVTRNRNRNGPDSGSNISEVCHTPGGADAGATHVIKSWRVGGSGFFGAPGNTRDEEELNLRPNVAYAIRVTADGAGTDINIEGDWYYEKQSGLTTTTTTTTSTTTS